MLTLDAAQFLSRSRLRGVLGYARGLFSTDIFVGYNIRRPLVILLWSASLVFLHLRISLSVSL